MSISKSFIERYSLHLLISGIMLMLLIFGYIFSKNLTPRGDGQRALIIDLNALLLLNQEIEAYFSYEYQNINYDETVRSVKAFKAKLAAIRKRSGTMEQTGDLVDALAQLDRVDALALQRNRYLEKHKSFKSVAINSMRYLPGLSHDIREYLLKQRFDTEYKNKVSEESVDMMSYIFYSLFKDAHSKSRLEENIKRTKALFGRDAKLDGYLRFLVLHATNIAEQKERINANLLKKEQLGLNKEVETLNLLFLGYLDVQNEKEKRLNFILFGAVVLLFVMLVFIRYMEQKFKHQLERLNKTLENRIKVETDKRMENEQILMQQSKLNAMGELITSISHQWRQPLNALGIIIQDIEDAYAFNEMDKPYIEKTITQSMAHINSMSKTIDEFRSFFKRSDRMVPIDVVKSVEYARQMLSYRIEGLHLNVSLIYDEREVYSVFGLRSEFEQILMILINNAIDAIVARFGKEERTAEGVIGIRVAVHDGITVTVEDNGIGIDPAIATRIFEPYFTTKDQGEGVGMGLYIAKLILENHMHGSLRYEKRDGKTVFIIRMEID